MKNFVREIGPSAEKLIDAHFRTSKNPAKTARAAINLKSLTEQYPTERVEAACGRANRVGKHSAKVVQRILTSGLDAMSEEPSDLAEPPKPQDNIRGASYFVPLLKSQQGGDLDV